MSKKLINGLKYEKLEEEELYDLSQWELVDIILAYREDLKAKEQECEAYKMEADEGKEIHAELKAENKHLNDLLNQALKELEKTRETLTEIKEIAEKLKSFYEELGKCEDLTVVRLKQILQKISECEVNND